MCEYKEISLHYCLDKYDIQRFIQREFGVKIALSKLKSKNTIVTAIRFEDGTIEVLDSKNKTVVSL